MVKKFLSTIVFVLVLGGCMIASVFTPSKEFSDLENRNLQQKPKISLEAVFKTDFQDQYEKYLADQIFFRNKWVSLYAQLEKDIGKKEVNGVYLGKDEYLIEKYTENDFDQEQQKVNIENMSSFLDVVSGVLGKSHVSCLLVPSKIDVLKNKISRREENYSGADVVEQVRKRAKNKERIVNLASTLQEKDNQYIYYRTDHHWTTLGAYYAYCAYESLNGKTAPDLDHYKKETVFNDFLGTTYNKAHVSVQPDEVTVFERNGEQNHIKINANNGEFTSDSFYFKDAAQDGFDRYQLFFSKNTGKIEITTSVSNNKTLLVLKDSFANCFVPFLANEYSKIIMIDFRYTKAKIKHIFTEYQDITDVLVLYNIEKFRKDTHLTSLEVTQQELKHARRSSLKEKKKDDDDIFSDLISLDD